MIGGIVPNLPGGLSGGLFFLLMANIGTTIAPWMLFFQQSSVVDKGMKEKDIPFGKMDTALGAVLTVVVAVFVIVVTGTLLYRAADKQRRSGCYRHPGAELLGRHVPGHRTVRCRSSRSDMPYRWQVRGR